MDIPEGLDPVINKVNILYGQQATQQSILNHINSHVLQSKSLLQLLERIQQPIQQLESYDIYKNIDIKFSPGDQKNDVNVIYDFKEKSRYFGTASHYIDKNGSAMVTTKGGLRNTFGFLDKFTIEYTKAVSKKSQSTYSAQLDFPLLTQLPNHNLSLNYQFSKAMLDQYVSEGNKSFNIALNNQIDNSTLRFENSFRQNNFTLQNLSQQSQQYFQNNEFLPTNKMSFSLNKVIKNTVQESMIRKRVQEGESISNNTEITIPFLSQVQFIKSELFYKKYYDLYQYSDFYRKLKQCNIEHNLKAGIVKGMNTNQGLCINDSFNHQTLRGFNEIDMYQGENKLIKPGFMSSNYDIYLKQSAKLNVYNYPQLKKANIVAFLHGTMGYFERIRYNQQRSTNSQYLKNNLRASAGLGISFDVGMGAKLEFLYNFGHFGRNTDSISKLQLRVAFND